MSALTLAPLWKRLLCIVYDLFVLTAISLAYFASVTVFCTVVLGKTPSNYHPNASGIWVQLGWVVSLLSFYCFFWMRVGQTVAMKAWRIKLITDNGEALRLSTCLLRCLLGTLSFVLFGLGYLWCWLDRDGKAIHDRLTKTSVIVLEEDKA